MRFFVLLYTCLQHSASEDANDLLPNIPVNHLNLILLRLLALRYYNLKYQNNQ
jgi:hypothetical protein